MDNTITVQIFRGKSEEEILANYVLEGIKAVTQAYLQQIHQVFGE